MWMLDADAGLPLWRPRRADSGVVLAFSTRRGGVSEAPFASLNLGRSVHDRAEAVAENRRRLLQALGFASGAVASAGQVHGAAVVEAERPGLHPNCDVLLTRVPGLPLAITTADCLPLLLVAPGVVAAAHSGWRGTAAGVPRIAVEALRAAAPSAGDVRVHLGPSIRSCCYRVGPEVARQFPEAALVRRSDSWHLDLVAAARLQLRDAGVGESSIHEVPACTACEPDWYFSHRRDQGRTGRHWAVAALKRPA